jgi:hypothetical protein
MRTVSQLSPGDLQILESIRSPLRKLGCRSFVESDDTTTAWVERDFPGWEWARIFPFFLPDENFIYLVSEKLASSSCATLCGVDGAAELNSYPEFEPLRKHGLLIIGCDLGGNHLAIDTKSAGALDAVLIDFGAVASFGLQEKYLFRSKRNLAALFDWIGECPDEFLNVWSVHYDSQADEK